MIEFVVGRRADLCDALYDQLLQYRHEIFVRRLGWDLPGRAPKRAREEDEFDTSHTVYLAATRGGHVVGCARLLPTTQPYLLEHVFPDLLGGEPVPRARGVWELSRFAAGSTRAAGRSDEGSLARAVFQLALFTGHVLGAHRLIGVASARVERFCARNGFGTLPLGARRPCDGVEVGAFAIRVTRACEAETSAALAGRPVRWLLAPVPRAARFCPKEEPKCTHEQHFEWRCA
jgi:acyl homoserine lactone synthase